MDTIKVEPKINTNESNSEFDYKKLGGLIKKLGRNGIDKAQLIDLAEDNNLRACSYGDKKYQHKAIRITLGAILGASAGYLSNTLCKYFGVNEAARYITDVVSVTITLGGVTYSNQLIREYQDYLFYHALRDKFKDKIPKD